MPSTLFNIFELLANYKRVIKNNNDMSIFYILYQVIILIFTIIGPGMIFILLIAGTQTALGVEQTTSIIINLIILLMFIIVCFVGKPDSQIFFAQILTLIYAMVMIAATLDMVVQIVFDRLSSPNLVPLCLVFGSILIAGLFHPQVKI
jgi:chitin synthase